MVVAEVELVHDARRHAQVLERAQSLRLATQARDRVHAGQVEAGMRPALLEHDLLAGGEVDRLVDAAAVGEVQGLLDAVGDLVDGRCHPRSAMWLEEARKGHPLRRGEDRFTPVRHELSGRVLDGQHLLAVRAETETLGEAAVPHVEGAFGPAEVAEDVRTRLTRKPSVESFERTSQLVFARRVDRHELPACRPVGVLAVAHEQQLLAPDVLEGQPVREAVVADDVQDSLCAVESRRHVDLPALLGQLEDFRRTDEPVVELGHPPPGRQRARRHVEVDVVPPRHLRRFVERRVRQAVRCVSPIRHGEAPP